MNAREVIQIVKTHCQIESELQDTDIKVDVIGNAKEAKAQVSYWVEGKMKLIELTARELPVIE
jgi:hypothetical protein